MVKGDYARARVWRIKHLPAVNPSFFCIEYKKMSFKEELRRKNQSLFKSCWYSCDLCEKVFN